MPQITAEIRQPGAAYCSARK